MVASTTPCSSGWGRKVFILSFRVSRGCDLRRPVVDSVADGTLAALIAGVSGGLDRYLIGSG